MSTYRLPIDINGRPVQLGDLSFWGDIRFDPNDETPTYIGLHDTQGVTTSNTNWKIYKFTTSSTYTTRIQLAYGAWDERTTLF